MRQFRRYLDAIEIFVFSLIGSILASVTCNNNKLRSIKIWNLSSGALIQELKDNYLSIYTIAFSLNGKILVSAGKSKTIKVWNI